MRALPSRAGWHIYHKAVASRLPLSTHLAEMPEELRLLQHRDGPLRGFLEDLGAWDDDWEPIGPRPADYVRKGELRNADWLIAHGTYLEPDDFWQLRPEAAPEGRRVAIAFCPRTHARFGHAPHPYRARLWNVKRASILFLGNGLSMAGFLERHASALLGTKIRFLHSRDRICSPAELFG